MKRKILDFILLAVLVLTCLFLLPTQAKAANESDLTFKLNEDGNSYYIDFSRNASGDLTIPATYEGKPVTRIAKEAFLGRSLTSVTILDSVTSIGAGAFSCCNSLTSVAIGKGVNSIAVSAFNNSEHLNHIWVDEENPNYCSDKNGVLFNKDKTKLLAVPGTAESYTVPNSVTSIGEYAFSACCKLTSVTLPDSITEIEFSAFSGCDNLTAITIPNSVTSIGGYAFAQCDSLTAMTIPDSVTSIGDGAFLGCDSLTSVTIPDSVTKIGYDAFGRCENLKKVYYGGDKTRFTEIEMGINNDPLINAKIVYNYTTPGSPSVLIVIISAAVLALAATTTAVIIIRKRKSKAGEGSAS